MYLFYGMMKKLSVTVEWKLLSIICETIFIHYISFQLLVGSEDYDIRVFHGDEIIAEVTETEVCFLYSQT